jgi:lysozyme
MWKGLEKWERITISVIISIVIIALIADFGIKYWAKKKKLNTTADTDTDTTNINVSTLTNDFSQLNTNPMNANEWTPSEQLKTGIKTFESGSPTNYENNSYKDSAGHWTIGFGHLLGDGDEFSNITWTNEQIDSQFDIDIQQVAAEVRKIVTQELKQGQFDAILDFMWGYGEDKFLSSTLWKVIQSNGSNNDINAQFNRWVYAKNAGTGAMEVLPGLVKRRVFDNQMWNA